MSYNVLITGGSGYLGGTLLNRLQSAGLPALKLYALVRKDSQAEAVKQYGAEPLKFDAYGESAVREAVLKHEINVVFSLHDAFKADSAVAFIKALAELKNNTGRNVHFLHTTGAKAFSSHMGAPIDKPFADNDNLHGIHKAQHPPIPFLQPLLDTNITVTELSESLGVQSYVFAPCIVYGKGEGFGNKISIQTVAVVDAAKVAKKVYRVDQGRPTWPVCHILDNTALYIQLLRNIVSGRQQGYGKNGYYLASPGSVAWEDIYSGIAKAMYKRGAIHDDTVHQADGAALEEMAQGLGCDKAMVAFQLGGACLLTAKHGVEIGWKPEYGPEHIFSSLDEEVDLIFQHKG
ncbi:NAD(P)-binding protein [Aureobasidium pullulans]|nr:NAD(P)-binding protein [Aureobasidium pullulans]